MEVVLEKLKEQILQTVDCEAIVLFGSYARGTQNSESDIDIAFKSSQQIDKQKIFFLKQELEDITNKDVDLINLDDIGDIFRYEILINGKTIYCKDEFKFELYKLEMYREFLDLNESIQPIIERVKKEKQYMENKAVILNKYESIEKCINRINEEYEGNINNLNNYSKLDAIILNLQRACELCIDIATYIVSTKKLGIPQSKKEAFELLFKNGYIDEETLKIMRGMIGFRNIAIHDYKEIDEDILRDIIENHLSELLEFARKML